MQFYKKHLKKHRALICVCALVLVFQAVFALSLPYFMGELVGVGVQQKGIDGEYPEKLTPKAMEIFRLVLPEEEYEQYLSCYTEKDGIYILREDCDSEKAGEIYANGVMSGFYTALSEVDGRRISYDKAKLESMMNLVTVNYLYSRIQRLEALTVSEKEAVYAEAKEAPEALKTQLAGFALPYFYKDAGGNLEKAQDDYIGRTGTLMALFAVLQTACFIIAGKISAKVSAKTEHGIREELLIHTASFTRKERRRLKADLYSVFSADVSSIGSITDFLITAVMYSPFVCIGGAVLSFMLSPALSTVVIATALVTVAIVFAIYRLTLPRYEKLQKAYGFLVRFAKSSISQLYTVRTMRTRDKERQRFLAVADGIRRDERFVLRSIFTALSLVTLLSNIITAVAVVISGESLLSSSLGIGDVIAFIQYSTLTVGAVTTLAGAVLFAPRAKGAFDRVDEIMSVKPSENEGTKMLSSDRGNSVEFCNVSLGGEIGLKNISFTARAGEITALVGPTGCGKTTLLSLLTLDADYTDGEILIDGIAMSEIGIDSLRSRVAFARTEPIIFSKSLRENMLLYGAADEASMDAAVEGCAADFITDRDAVLYNKAGRFSGGQRSRIALACAFSKKAGIYIADDCLRTVDAATEEHILSYFNKLKENSAVILVTQRINSLMRADKIVVFSKEGIEAQGTHSELLASSEFYRELALLQGMEVTSLEG